nr:MAG TPA: hypothetical protein [Caudoviricetes sp.]
MNRENAFAAQRGLFYQINMIGLTDQPRHHPSATPHLWTKHMISGKFRTRQKTRNFNLNH